ncbi:DUF3887 domain-containing protein [Streptomyces sp. NBC_00354]|uniref:DUF3887 domain-containing protein n=1 Tax=Streptomyces sp. NBC_00354 TaxID=2975723 RepID=UPI002E25A122
MDVSGAAEPERGVVVMPRNVTTFSSGERQLVQAVATGALAACMLLPASDFASAAMQAHAATTTVAGRVAAASPAARTPYDRTATRTLDDIVSGNVAGATAHFDATLRKVLTPDALAGAWKTYQATFGRYRSHGDPEDVAAGEFTVVSVPLRMEREAGEFRVSFHEDGSVAGLWLLEPGVPISLTVRQP